MSCSIPFLLERSPFSACNTSRHRKNETGAFPAPLILPVCFSISMKKTGLRDPTQDVFIGFMQIVTY
jgi:hypothetical protein